MRSFNVSHVRVEVNAYQKALARDDSLRASARELNFQIDEWMTDDRKNSPEFGIPNLARWMRDGLFSVPAQTFQDQQYGKELERALIRYPLKPNDLPMALWLAWGMMRDVWNLYTKMEPAYLPGRENRVPAYMMEHPVRIDMSKAMAG